MEEIKECDTEVNKESMESKSPSVFDRIFDSAVPKPISFQRRTGATRRSTKGGWTEEEDKVLTIAVQNFNGKSWKKIAECVSGRTAIQCQHRWQKVLNPTLVKGPWSKQEDNLLIELVAKKGKGKWSEISKSFPGRIGKQCRERWHNHLNPDIIRTKWTTEEELTLINLHRTYENKWAAIAKFLPGRSENAIKNHWNCSIRKNLDRLAHGSNPYCHQTKSEKEANDVTVFDDEQTNKADEFNDSLPSKALSRRVQLSLSKPSDTSCNRRTQNAHHGLAFLVPTKRLLESFDGPQRYICSANNFGNGNSESSDQPDIPQSSRLVVFQPHENKVVGAPENSQDPNLSSLCSKALQKDLGNTSNRNSVSSGQSEITQSSRLVVFQPDENKVVVALEDSKDPVLGSLCSKPLLQKDLNIPLETNSVPSTDTDIQTTPNSVSSRTPPSQNGVTVDFGTIKSMLKKAARGYGNMPSIIRRPNN